ncbi:DUF6230 family protein [Kitasatospora aureofaciens]|uniref:Cholesterol esterase n=1 Tax=Kitasatospora aureofaciens TaxID=1894 RepID=A0A1E7N8B7_KITAU|nr:DUF6230 family protein [Kitasatospora aureofaciens]QEU99864.1 cholesterol esterase [Streptomyces viridifaciens]ARF78657.1 cholesterol esterase [Kitasatospora aureofaciens]OEV36894.1 cholesterol esterase [Kitasatospora aureofaciens]UKZ06016.1 DUF6230 family protein [Streptomyces viridifaciens]GGU78448.1 cholesterol esterase [Kitasatospora aureofaciens]
MSKTYGKTRWKRFALVMVPSVAATAMVGVSIANSALAASFSISGQQFKVRTSHLEGENFAQFGTVDVEANGTPHPVAVSAFDKADITNLCQSVVTDLSAFGLGKITLQLNAGGPGSKPVHAEKLLIDLEELKADATFENMNIGQDASTLSGSATQGWTPHPGVTKAGGGSGLPTGPTGFAQSAKTATLDNVQQTARATSAGTFVLSGLNLSLKHGDGAGNECF